MALLEPKPTLQKKLAEFKATVRYITIFCCDTEDERKFKTCQSQQNRLLALAVANKHACIQGMPEVGATHARHIADHVLRLRGICTKPQQMDKANGVLKNIRKTAQSRMSD